MFGHNLDNLKVDAYALRKFKPERLRRVCPEHLFDKVVNDQEHWNNQYSFEYVYNGVRYVCALYTVSGGWVGSFEEKGSDEDVWSVDLSDVVPANFDTIGGEDGGYGRLHYGFDCMNSRLNVNPYTYGGTEYNDNTVYFDCQEALDLLIKLIEVYAQRKYSYCIKPCRV